MSFIGNIAHAQTGTGAGETATVGPAPTVVYEIVGKVNQYIINPVIILMFAVALVYFLYGLVGFLSTNSDKDRTVGKDHMLYGILGMFIMVSVFAILRIIANTLGADNVDIP